MCPEEISGTFLLQNGMVFEKKTVIAVLHLPNPGLRIYGSSHIFTNRIPEQYHGELLLVCGHSDVRLFI